MHVNRRLWVPEAGLPGGQAPCTGVGGGNGTTREAGHALRFWMPRLWMCRGFLS